MVDFSQLKKNRKQAREELEQKLNKENSGYDKQEDDGTYWKPTFDKAGNSSATIRFLPAPPNEDLPYVKYWDHFFKGPTGRYYVENSLNSIGQPDPVSEYNSKIWKKAEEIGDEVAKNQVRERKRRLHYIAGIFVLDDPMNPENNGKVFRYRFGKKIYDKINEAMHPKFATDQKFNPFDFWEGKNFRLRIHTVLVGNKKMPNYDNCSFEDALTALHEDDEVLEGIWKSQYSLADLVSPDKFKSYDELKKNFDAVMGINSDRDSSDYADSASTDDIDINNLPKPKFTTKPKVDEIEDIVPEAKTVAKKQSTPVVTDDEDDDEMAFFNKLKNS